LENLAMLSTDAASTSQVGLDSGSDTALDSQVATPVVAEAIVEPVAEPVAEIVPSAFGPVPSEIASSEAMPGGLVMAMSPAEVDQAIEVMILTSSRPVPMVKMAIALGLIEPEAPQGAPQGAPRGEMDGTVVASEGAEGSGPSAGVSEAVAPAPVVRSRRKGKVSKKADPEVVIAQSVARLNGAYASTNRQFRIELVAGGYRLLTLPQHHGLLARFHGLGAQTRLSKPALETLAIIAYKQPVTRAQLEAIRGVACGEVLRSLLDRRLVNIVGRAEELGRPMLYGTTRAFLELFGLSSLKDLPAPSDLNLAPAKL
jgi:segregation and condensation protein B